MHRDDDIDQRAGVSVPTHLSVILSVMLAILPLGIWVPLRATGEDATISMYHRWVSTLLPLDLLLLTFTILAVPLVIRSFRSPDRRWGTIAMAAFAALSIVALAVNPTLLGASFVARWVGATAVVAVIGWYSWSEFRVIVAAPLMVAGVVQALIGLWQHPGPGADFSYYGDQIVSHGTFVHQAGLALFLVFVITVAVATMPVGGRSRTLWLVAVGLMSAAIAGTLSRTGAVTLVLIWGAYGWGLVTNRRVYSRALAASTVPFLFTAGFTLSGWFSRVAQSSSGTAGARTSGRTAMMLEALPIIGRNPIVGVGPGGYVAELTRLNPTAEGWALMPVHMTPLLAAAELGVLAGALIMAILVVFGWRAIRTSPAALAVFFSVAVFQLLELRTYYVPTDVVVFAVWLATLDLLARLEHEHDHGTLVS